MVTGPVGECLQASIEDGSILDCPAPLRHLHDSSAGYKYSDLLTYHIMRTHTTMNVHCSVTYMIIVNNHHTLVTVINIIFNNYVKKLTTN